MLTRYQLNVKHIINMEAEQHFRRTRRFQKDLSSYEQILKETAAEAAHPIHGKLFDSDILKQGDFSPRRQICDRKLSQNREKIKQLVDSAKAVAAYANVLNTRAENQGIIQAKSAFESGRLGLNKLNTNNVSGMGYQIITQPSPDRFNESRLRKPINESSGTVNFSFQKEAVMTEDRRGVVSKSYLEHSPEQPNNYPSYTILHNKI